MCLLQGITYSQFKAVHFDTDYIYGNAIVVQLFYHFKEKNGKGTNGIR